MRPIREDERAVLAEIQQRLLIRERAKLIREVMAIGQNYRDEILGRGAAPVSPPLPAETSEADAVLNLWRGLFGIEAVQEILEEMAAEANNPGATTPTPEAKP